MDRGVNDTATPIWGEKVVDAEYAGHPGTVYETAPRSLAELLTSTGTWSGREFLVQGGRRVTHPEFRAAVPAAAARLSAFGVTAGSRVMVHSYNSPEFVLAVWAIWWLGAVPVFANRWWGKSETDHALTTARPGVVLTDTPAHFDGVADVHDLSSLAGTWEADTERSLESVESSDADAPGLILFTSGSSGAPKAVELSIRSIIANQHNLLARSRRLPQQLDSEAPQPVTLVCTPLFHIGGVSNVLTNLVIGGRLVLTEGKFDAGEILGLIETERVQSWGGVPTMAIRVLEHPNFATTDLSSLRSFPLGGAPVSSSLLARMTSALPQLERRGLANTWGMTESGGFVTVAGNADLTARPGTVGKPYPVVELKIDDPNEASSGEILVRSPTVMLGYLGIDDGTVDEDGWLHTGDLGHLDADGYLYLDGRSKDIVIRGGENIACAHVEQALTDHPVVVEVAVFGVPDEDLGEELAAMVVRRSGEEVTIDELRAHCRKSLAYFEVPTLWQIVDRPLPTLAGEKIDKKTVKASFVADIQEVSR